MELEGKTFIQCQCCGHIEATEKIHNIDEMYIKNYECPCCGHTVGLNVGNNELDIYELENINVDQRFFIY